MKSSVLNLGKNQRLLPHEAIHHLLLGGISWGASYRWAFTSQEEGGIMTAQNRRPKQPIGAPFSGI
jgi:hypothetical protein